MEKKGTVSHKIIVIIEIAFICLFFAIFYYILKEHAPAILEILKSGDVNQIDDYLKQYGTDGKLLLIVLQIIETVAIILPSPPVYICSGIMFGKFWGTVVCYVVNLILTILIFEFASKMKEFTKKYFSVSNQKGIESLLRNAKHLDRVVIAMCLVQIVPGGMIPFLASQTNITLKDFVKGMAIGSLPTILIYVWLGDLLTSNNYKVTAVIIGVIIIIAILALIYRKKIIDWLSKEFVG